MSLHSEAGASVEVPAGECLEREALEVLQGRRLRRLVAEVHARNPFYGAKFLAAGLGREDVTGLADLARLPLTSKAELVADQFVHAPWGTNLTEPRAHYTRYCQTSSTTGRPLKWCDTGESWQWMLECWKAVYRAARVGSGDRILFPFSFGPFLGFWAAFDAAPQIGAQAIPAGGMSSHLRLAMIESVGATVVCCTPTYALRLAEVAASEHGAGWSGLSDEPGARHHRRRRTGRQHPRDARADSGQLGRARDRPSRPHRDRAGQFRVLGPARRPASARERVHRRGDRPGDRRPGG